MVVESGACSRSGVSDVTPRQCLLRERDESVYSRARVAREQNTTCVAWLEVRLDLLKYG